MSAIPRNFCIIGSLGGVSADLDTIGSTRGSLLYRGAAAWSVLTPGTVGFPLVSGGAGADPSYSATPTLNTVTAQANTDLTLNAGSGNQGIGLVPTGTGSVYLPSTVTAGLKLYNTADQTTNIQRLSQYYSSNIALIGTDTIGAVANTPLQLYSQLLNGGAFFSRLDLLIASGSTILRQGAYTSTTGTTNAQFSTAATFISFGNLTSTATSGTSIIYSLNPTYNQVSGNAANTDFRIVRTETALGSGAQRFAEFFGGAAGTTSLFSVVNNGHLLLGGLTTDGTGVLQFPTATTSAGGISFGTDMSIYRTAAGSTAFDAVGQASSGFFMRESGSNKLSVQTVSGAGFISTNTAASLTLQTNATPALTLDSSQNATFAQNITLQGTALITKPGGTIPIFTTNTAITTGAGAGVGTLTNAPASTNPTKWIPINDNGTIRYFPAW